jgi:hypothetical protein
MRLEIHQYIYFIFTKKKVIFFQCGIRKFFSLNILI